MQRFPTNRYWWFCGLTLIPLAWDLISKAWVFAVLGYPFRSSEWVWSTPFLWGRFSIQFTTSFNEGALWGVGQGYSGVFALLSILAAAFVGYWLFIRGEARSLMLTITLALIMAGTLGNLFDRLYLHGCRLPDGTPIYGVRDFLNCTIPLIGFEWPLRFFLIPAYEWPIFNFADTYLVTGALLLVVQSFFVPDEQQANAGASAPTAANQPPAPPPAPPGTQAHCA